MSDASTLSEGKRRLLERLVSGTALLAPADEQTIATRPVGAIVPISAEQTQIWFHAELAGGLPLYHEPVTIHRRGLFDLAIMEASLNRLLQRHEIWRTGIALVDGTPCQIVHPNVRIALPLVDLSRLSPEQQEEEALRLATDDSRRPFDLARPPLLRARVLQFSATEHRLHLTLHHIIFDGVSIYRIVMPELAAIYAALARGEEPALAAPILQYGDYTIWQAHRLAGGVFEAQLGYWRRQLADLPAVVGLPYDRPRPASLSHQGSMVVFLLPKRLADSLRALGRAEGATLYMVLLAGFAALLHRYGGQRDIAIGGVVDTRRRPELESLIGYFLNSIVLRLRPAGEMRFRDHLAEVRQVLLGALAASDVPFDRVVRDLAPTRDASGHPLFQILFSMEPPVAPFEPGWDLTQMEVTVGIAKFDLYLELDERPDAIHARFLYNTDLFERDTIERMIGHWTMLLASACADPARSLADLPMLTADEHATVTQRWNDTDRVHPDRPLHALLAEQALATPDAIAIESGSGTEIWTYRMLQQRARVIAGHLRANGVGPGSLVGIALERGPEMVAGLIAILQTGAAYLPLDLAFPAARVAMILDDAQPTLLLTERKLIGALPLERVPMLVVEACLGMGEPAATPVSASDLDDLAYVLYTSGSTGRPKGVEIPHRALVNLLGAMRVAPGFGASDRLLAVTTLSFDIAALEIFLPLVSGGTLVIADRVSAVDPNRLAQLIDRSCCSLIQATPAMWRALLEVGWNGRRDLTILCGGETLPRDLADRLLTRCGALWNMYGPTETTIWSSIHRVAVEAGPVPIGRPIANTRFYILDESGNPQPVGVAGELHIGGIGLALGYRHRPDLTAERFAASAAAGGARLYRTGDVARFRADGAVVCLGRNDAQVKVRGFRVAPEEIEAALAPHPGVATCAVRAWPDVSGEMSLVAYIVPRAEWRVEPDALRLFLGRLVPDYMQPARYVVLPALPLTPNGKIDRNALPPPGVLLVAPRTPPRGKHEEWLALLWAELLGVSTIGREDDFFALGGHSLMLARLLRSIERAFSRKLTMAALFHAPRLDQMAALLDGPQPAIPSIQVATAAGGAPFVLWLNAGPTLRPLAQALGSDRPLVSVSLGLDAGAALVDGCRFEEIAHVFVAAVRAVQPQGPYAIAGWCTEGILAYEVATQLAVAGAGRPLVVLLHAVNPVHFRRMGGVGRGWGKLRYHFRRLMRLRGKIRARYAILRLAGFVDWATRPLVRDDIGDPCGRRRLDRAALDYVPKSYDGPVLLVQPYDRPDILDYRSGWAEIARGDFTATDCPGDHRTMLDPPNVQQLASAIMAALDRTSIRGGSVE